MPTKFPYDTGRQRAGGDISPDSSRSVLPEINTWDLKPENIMVDDDDNIKLIDFGIAGSEGSRRLTFAKLSNVMGTPDYISQRPG